MYIQGTISCGLENTCASLNGSPLLQESFASTGTQVPAGLTLTRIRGDQFAHGKHASRQ